MTDAVAVLLFARRHRLRHFRGRRFRCRLLGPRRRRGGAGRAAPGGDRPLDRPGVGGQPRLADLRLRRAVDRLPGGIRVDHADPVRPACAAALGIVLRGSSFAFRKTVFRTRDRRNFGAAFALSSVLVPYCFGAVAGAIASGRVPAGGSPATPWDSWINPTSILGGVLAVVVAAYLAAVYLVWDARRLGDPDDGGRTSVAEPSAPPSSPASWRSSASSSCGPTPATCSTASNRRALPLVIISAVCGTASLVLLLRRAQHGARLPPSAPWPAS